MAFHPLKTAVLIAAFLVFGFAPPIHASVREIATISTSAGTMEFELFQDVSPRTVANFKYLAETRFYDGTAFHRLIPGFMIQGGCPNTRNDTKGQYATIYGQGGPEYTIPDEPSDRADRRHVRGVLSMAKTGAPNSGGSQFFIMFGDAVWLDNLHAPIGFLITGGTGAAASSGTATLAALEKKPLVSKTDTPSTRLVINSVRIRSEIASETPKYQSGEVGGLLRSYDRSVSAGKYRVALNSGGSFSGRLQLWGRQCSFSGTLAALSSSALEKEGVVLADPRSKAPLRVRVRVRQSASLKNSVTVSVCDVTSAGADVLNGTQVVGSGELAASSVQSARFSAPVLTTGGTISSASLNGLLATRYNVGFSQAILGSGSLALAEMKGSGYLTVGLTPSTGLCVVSGKLADARALSFSEPVANEGGRISLSVCNHESSYAVTSLTSVDLSVLSRLPYVHRLAGVLELPRTNSMVSDGVMMTLSSSGSLASYTSVSNYLYWQQGPRTSGVIKNQIPGAFLLPTVTAWRAPKSGTMLNPFSADKPAQLTINGGTVGNFTVSNTNTAALFSSTSGSVLLKFDPAKGTFSGTHNTKAFQGVLLQPVGSKGRGVGFSLTDSASVPVAIAP
jgi:peptidyl-prolyl cis-trans isomerase B (cyclophilin B)